MDNQFTQEIYDQAVEFFKGEVEGILSNHQGKSLGFILMSGDEDVRRELIGGFFTWQEQVNPIAEDHGLETKTLSEIFGMEIKLDKCD